MAFGNADDKQRMLEELSKKINSLEEQNEEQEKNELASSIAARDYVYQTTVPGYDSEEVLSTMEKLNLTDPDKAFKIKYGKDPVTKDNLQETLSEYLNLKEKMVIEKEKAKLRELDAAEKEAKESVENTAYQVAAKFNYGKFGQPSEPEYDAYGDPIE